MKVYCYIGKTTMASPAGRLVRLTGLDSRMKDLSARLKMTRQTRALPSGFFDLGRIKANQDELRRVKAGQGKAG